MNIAETRVAELMSSPVISLSPEDDLAAASAIAALKHIRHLPVIEQGRLVGLVSHRDILAARPSSTLHLTPRENVSLSHKVTVREMMRTEVRTATGDMLARDAAQLMLAARIGCLPVVNDGVVVGILTEADLVRLLVRMLAPS